ncbi:MAG: class E sortase, partial [Acidimicrobiales bacterium]
TTYGAPFGDLDLIQPGDQIIVETLYGTYYYEVLPQTDDDGNVSGHFIVDDSAVEVVDDQGDNRLTLTACHPKYSAAQRIIVSAKLVSAPAPELPTTTSTSIDELADEPTEPEVAEALPEENVLTESLGWNNEEKWPTILWGAAAALVALAGYLLGRAWQRLPAYVVITPVFLYVLWGCFTHLDKWLPAL